MFVRIDNACVSAGPERTWLTAGIEASSSTLFLTHFIYIKLSPSKYVIFLTAFTKYGEFSDTIFSKSFCISWAPPTQMLNLLLLTYTSLRFGSLFKIYVSLYFLNWII